MTDNMLFLTLQYIFKFTIDKKRVNVLLLYRLNKMEFIKNKVVRDLPTDNKYWIEEVGYNDFEHTKPFKIFRKQFFHTFHIVLDGEGTLEIGGKKHSIKKGGVFYVPPNVSFRYYPQEKKEWKYIWFIFKNKTAIEEIEKIGFSVDNPTANLCCFEEKIEKYIDFIKKIERNKKAVFLCQSMFLYSIADFAKGDIEYDFDGKYYLKRANDYIRNNCFDTEFKISHVSEFMHLSPEYFSRLFKKEAKMNALELVKELRMERASELLSDTDYSVKQISIMCGYNDYSHFCREFKKKFGTTAVKYRENK